MYVTLKIIHVSFAIVSIAGFVVRGFWMFGESAKLDRRIVRIAPHVVDTAFLISGIWLIVLLQLNVMQHDWLIAKFLALVAYIVLGAVALRRGKTKRVRSAAFVAALLAYLYILGVALSKSPASWI
ncbi:MAG: SirB2 family protein [Woeseiaceae bacterium]